MTVWKISTTDQETEIEVLVKGDERMNSGLCSILWQIQIQVNAHDKQQRMQPLLQ